MFNLKNSEKIGLLFIYTFMGLGIYFSRTDLRFYEGVFVREDGIVEWLTVLALFLCAVTNFYRASILRPFRNNLFTISLIAMGFVYIFGVGEEISWGQRLFDVKSPEFFVNHNSQMETNFHNLILGGVKINKLIFGTFLGIIVVTYFLILPFLYRKYKKVEELVNSFALPVPKISHLCFYLVLAGLVQFIDSGKSGEMLEFGGCWIFLIMILRPYNRSIFSRKSFDR